MSNVIETREQLLESETDEYIDVLVTRWQDGNSVGTFVEREWKEGSPENIRAKIIERAREISELLSAADKNWATLSAAQREGALRLTVRAVANLCALAAEKLDVDPGEG